MSIIPRNDIKKNLKNDMIDTVKKNTQENEIIPIDNQSMLAAACKHHNIELRCVESVKVLDGDTILMTLKPPRAGKLRYTRNET